MGQSSGTTSSRAARRAGYVVAVAVNVVLLWLVDVSPGWSALHFLTGAFTEVLPLLNLSLAATVAANLVYLVRDSRRVRAIGQATLSAIGLALAARLLVVFPFDFSAYAGDWELVTRVVLVLALVGSAVGVITGLARLAAPSGLSAG